VRTFLLRGMLAGLCAAFLAFEESQAAALAEPEHEEVSRSVQSTIGLAVGLAATGVALGGFFAIAFAFAYGRLGRLGARGTALVVSALGFVAVYLAPFLKYAPNPPATGDPETINQRTVLYFLITFVSVVAMALAVTMARRLAPRFGSWNATLLAAVGYLAVVAFCIVALPGFDEVPDGFPPSVLWQFRLSSPPQPDPSRTGAWTDRQGGPCVQQNGQRVSRRWRKAAIAWRDTVVAGRNRPSA
jgi:hypothetical protein